MGGRASRRKGCRTELILRDSLRLMGWSANRVPLSGAAQGFKGDVIAERGEQRVNFEMKSRKDAFKKIYELYFLYFKRTQDEVLSFVLPATDKEQSTCVAVSTSLDAVLERGGVFPFPGNLPEYAVYKRTFKKIENLRKLLGAADVLVLKDDRRPLLYLRFK